MMREDILLNGHFLPLSKAIAQLKASSENAPWKVPVWKTMQAWIEEDFMVSTSGTTGKPKEIRFDRDELVASANITASTFGLVQGDRALLCLPADFIAGKMMIIRAIVLGLDLHIIEPTSIPQSEMNGTYQFAAMVPNQLSNFLTRSRDAATVEKVIVGGGPVSPGIEEHVHTKGMTVWQTYGSTETCTHVAIRSLRTQQKTYTAVDKIHFSATIDDRLVIHTPHLHTRVHETNDIVSLMDDQTFQWHGRADNVVLSGGLKIYPEELELRCANLITDPFYFSKRKHSELSEALILVVETNELNEDELLAALRTVLSPLEMPKQVVCMEEFNRTHSGKIKRL